MSRPQPHTMAEVPPQDPATAAAGPITSSPETVEALEWLAEYMAADDRLNKVMEEKVFSQVSDEDTQLLTDSLGKRHKHTMCLGPFIKIMALIWKESIYVTDADLNRTTVERTFKPGALNANSLGMIAARGKETVNSAQQQVAKFVDMAVAYGLVDQDPAPSGKSSGKPRELRGTALLHDVICALKSPPQESVPTPAESSNQPNRTI